MKRIVSILLILSFVFSFSLAFAEISLSEMSFEELLELQQQVNLAIFSSDKWIEVEVPMGVWDIGKDIPAGRYEIVAGETAKQSYLGAYFCYYLERHDESGQPDKLRGTYRIKDGENLVIELFDGNVIKIEDGSVIFKHYVPSFNFN